MSMLSSLPDASVQCCVTSPPYFGLRSYLPDDHPDKSLEIGMEPTTQEYVARLVAVFSEVRRVLKGDGVLWLNLGDSYAGSWGNYGGQNRGKPGGQREIVVGSSAMSGAYDGKEQWRPPTSNKMAGLKPKDLIGIPWRVAFALQEDGWWLRQDIVWAKPNPMPESVTDRCTKAHEYLFLLAKSERYHFDADAISEESVKGAAGSSFNTGKTSLHQMGRSSDKERLDGGRRNRRSVWTVATKPCSDAHFAVMPEALVEPCILAGSRSGDTVLDPFFGSGTVGRVAERLGRDWIGIDLNPDYLSIQQKRTAQAGLCL